MVTTIPSPADPDTALAAVVELRSLAERLEAQAVQQALADGWTWEQIAQALGVSRQAAHKKHSDHHGHRRSDRSR